MWPDTWSPTCAGGSTTLQASDSVETPGARPRTRSSSAVRGARACPTPLSFDRDGWAALTAEVSDDLIDLTVGQADEVSAKALRTGNNQLLTALLGSLVALLVAIAAILWAVRQSRVLVDRALSVRLARLGMDADALVDQRLPAVMERLRRREPVDLVAEFATANYGSDEIGQVADVINRSLQVAAGAAVDEAKARAAGTAMLMGVARRPQRPLQRGLKVVEDLQGQIGDENLLVHLFDIHHQLNQTRRFLENLVILAGGQIGRRFQKPMPLRRVLLASFAEARNYQRITLRSAADVALVGHAVAEIIHLHGRAAGQRARVLPARHHGVGHRQPGQPRCRRRDRGRRSRHDRRGGRAGQRPAGDRAHSGRDGAARTAPRSACTSWPSWPSAKASR